MTGGLRERRRLLDRRTAPRTRSLGPAAFLMNDIHSRLNGTVVAEVLRPRSVDEIAAAVRRAREDGLAVSLAGARHAMGGQQFGRGALHLDLTDCDRVTSLDEERGIVDAGAGILWPELMDALDRIQAGRPAPWGIVQKQTGADRLSLGGALSANIHGRGLRFAPIVQDVESFVLVGPDGEARTCSRTRNADLFRLAIGGYGLFGAIASVRLRLARRRLLERVVAVIDVEDLIPAVERRVGEGALFGDFQFMTDESSDGFLRRGVFSCYRPVDSARAIPARQRSLSRAGWARLLELAHVDKRRAFETYAAHYLATSGQVYASDRHQEGLYLDDYHGELDRRLGSAVPATEMITEIYVPRRELAGFLTDVRRDSRAGPMRLIYGTVRFIEEDRETFLPWAREAWACVIFNLCVTHAPEGLDKAASDFRRLIDRGLERGGSYYLTYHRFATRHQVRAAHPRFVEFLSEKRRRDPEERFQSDWYRHHRDLFADAIGRGPAMP